MEFYNLAINTALCLSYDGYLCKGMLFQLKATFYKALTYYSVHLCFSTRELQRAFLSQITPHCRSVKSASRAKQENLYRSKISFTVRELW